MCSESVARVFKSCYPAIGALSMAACIYAVSVCPPIHAELYTTTVHPVNGTLEVVRCDSVPVLHCETVVDQPKRLRVHTYHMSMGIPFIVACGIGTVFFALTRKEQQMLNVNMLFIPDSYAPVNAREGSSAYRWEIIFWVYVLVVHIVLVSALTSPVDVFDTAVVVISSFLCLVFLCRPRSNEDADSQAANGGMTQAFVLSSLLVCTWIAFTSIPHMYEPDRAWLFAVLVALDSLLMLVHMYDGMPTMYTIVMGRLTFVALMNLVLAYAFFSLKDRLGEYAVASAAPGAVE